MNTINLGNEIISGTYNFIVAIVKSYKIFPNHTMEQRRIIHLKDQQNELEDLVTPCYVVPTEYGLIPCIPPDISGTIPLLLSAADFLDSPLSHTDKRPTDELGLGKRWFFLSPSAPYFNMEEGPKKEGVAVYCLNGSLRVISPKEYEDLVNWIRPACTVSLYSQIPPNATSRQKKLRIDATKAFAKDYPMTNNFAHGISQKGDSALFAQFLVPFTEKEAKIIKTAIEKFDSSKARMIQFFGHPNEVILARSLGFDIFCATLPNYYAQHSYALTFPYFNQKCEEGTKFEAYSNELGIDLRERSYEHDHKPIDANCKCMACQKYTRSYIHHLLNVHEMLGVELLVAHNIHYYNEFIKQLY